MSRPPINPEKSVAGIALDPQTLERVIPESRRPDGTVRKQIKIRPGFTPQEDVRRFRGTRQAQMDANALPKGHIIGWAPPPKSTANTATDAKPLSKSAKKNAKRKEKREKEKGEAVPENWDDDDEETKSTEPASSATKTSTSTAADPKATSGESTSKGPESKADELSSDALADKLDKLEVK